MQAFRQLSARQLTMTTSAFALALGCALPAAAQTVPVEPTPQTAPETDRNIAPSSAAVEPKKPSQTVDGTSKTDGETADGQTVSASSGQGSEDPTDILVVGTRASLQSAIARKRNAGTVVDSIVADDIASFPDKNVGDSLARITGVQLSRDFGEGTQVSIRGVEPDLNRVEINGVSQVSATGGRAGDFRELATELVKSIDVYKGYQVDLTEGGIGGTVSIETRKPLELKKALGSVVLSEQYLETMKDWRPRGTIVLGSPHFLIDGLGVLLNVTYDDKTTRQDYASNTNYKLLADFDRSDQKTVANPDYADYATFDSCSALTSASAKLGCQTQFFDWVPTVPRYRNWIRRDKRLSGDFSVQYEAANNFRVYAEAQINNRNQRLNDTNYSLDMGRYQRFQLDDPTVPRVAEGTSTVDANHVVTSFTTALDSINIGTAANPVYSGSSNILGVQRRDFSYDQKSKYLQTGFEWNLDRVHVKGLASYAKADTTQETNLISLSTGIAGVTVDRRNPQGVPVFIYPSTIDPADPSIYTDYNRPGNAGQAGPTLQYRPGQQSNTEKQLKIDVDVDVDRGLLKSIKYGGQFRWQNYISYAGGGSRLLSAPGVTPLQYQSSANVSFNTQIVDAATVPQRRDGNTFYLTRDEYASLINSLGTTTSGQPLFSGISGVPGDIPGRIAYANFDPKVLGQYFDLSGFDQDLVRSADGLPQIPQYKIDETIASGYVMGNIETHVFGMRLTGNGGLRYTFTRDDGTGTNVSRVTRFKTTGSGTETVVVAAQELSLQNSYYDVLPAFNAALEFTPNLVLRANWAKNLARPRPTDLVPNINCLDDATIVGSDDTCSAGNPDLKPYRADQWELNLAWYPNPDTLVSLGYYKKYESSFVVSNVTRSGVDLFGDGVLYTVRQPVNGFGALLDGIEFSAQTVFSFLPSPFDGFGASGNVTWARAIRTNLTNSATGEPLDEYPGLSKWTFNASVFYDKGFLNARLSYNYRSDWLVVVADSNNGNLPIYRQAEGYLDGKVTFRFPKYHTSLFVEGQNLNKEYSRTYVKGIGTSDVYYPGRRFFAGVQFKF
ncbi:TonB-dependent receptor [Stakelama pacifica]|uniref:TonB-dependent receptor n=1 Tax=Stakelama pacifica TaxID=517720 RepID=A0A4R6FC32_9SPHN|nr:TonB-dependent receptor [Stakelama pacifica]TDN78607.1 TonB-dependent receptor [Stakelama pacifica]GGO99394.1 TonB-dependent receptor [Stakelama pacifica]